MRPLSSMVAALVLLPTVGASAQQPVRHDSAGVHIVVNSAPRWTEATRLRVDPTPLVTLGSNAAVPQEQFSKVVGAVRLSDGTVVVSDQKALELRLFDAHGKFLRTIGRKGEGPGDFKGPALVMVTAHDTIVTWDVRSSRLTYFDAAGHVLRTVAVEQLPSQTDPRGQRSRATLTVLGRFGDGTFLAQHWGQVRVTYPGQEKTEMRVDSILLSRISDAKSVDLMTVMYNENWTYAWQGGITFDPRPFGRKGAIAPGGSAYYYTDGRQFEISEYSSSGKLIRQFQVRRPLSPVTAEDIRKNKAVEIAAADEKYRALQEEIEAWMPFPKYKAAFDTVQIDAGGRLWARVYDSEKKPPRWEVFGSDGAYLGTVILPNAMDVLQIGKDFLLARVKGADDEEMVNVYRVH